MKNRIMIFDTTLRDGEQAPGFSMNLEDKIRLALQLEKLQVDILEAGFPIASEGDFLAVREISKRIENCSVAGLCRAVKSDIDRAWEALKYAKNPRIHTFIATSDIHLKYKLNLTRPEVLNNLSDAVQYARSLCDNVEFSAEDASRSDIDFLCEVVNAAIKAGATVVNIPDTVGYSLPLEFGNIIKYIRENVPETETITLGVHCHNDLGLAVSNSLYGMENGAKQIECTINGIGERAGNTSLEEVVMAIKTKSSSFDTYTNINTSEIYPASQLLTEITGVGVQPNKAIVGANAFAHEAGIHQDGVLKNPLTYEIMTPESVGVPGNRIVIGKHSGRHAVKVKLQDMGYELIDRHINEIYIELMKVADINKEILEEDFRVVVEKFKRKNEKVTVS